ncbi:MAG: protease inhibitor I42 family protein [Legionellaceae bacterium]|nr:protease inhibitor I42 family protein [Legionellaceae bacterium]
MSTKAFASLDSLVFDAVNCVRFEVKLPANPTTGFQWTLQNYDKTHFEFEKDIYMASEPNLPGAPGQHVFYFKQKEHATCPRSTVLCFRHARSWEADSATCTEVTVHFSENNALKN